MNRDIYEAITGRFIEQLKRGTVPWQSLGSLPEHSSAQALPRNQCPLLGSTDYQSPFWIS